METKEKTTNREQALQERMKAETERIVGELCQLYSPEMKDQLEQAYLETVTGDPEKASKLLLDVQAVKETDDIRFLQAVAYIRFILIDLQKQCSGIIKMLSANIRNCLQEMCSCISLNMWNRMMCRSANF